MKTKRLLAWVLTLAMIISVLPMNILTVSAAETATSQPYSGTPASSFTAGNGTADSPYEIDTAEELYYFANLVNGGSYTIHGKLTADIVVNENVLKTDYTLNGTPEYTWTPIGNTNNPDKAYQGTLDGSGHTISGLYVDSASGYQGFVGYLKGTVKNLGIIDSYITSTSEDVGAVAGFAGKGGSLIENCYSNSAVFGKNNVGGITGRMSIDSTVRYCLSYGAQNGNEGVGGIVGFVDGALYNSQTKPVLESCYSTSSVYGKASYNYTITNCATVSTEQLASGEVTYLLNNGVTDGTQVWYQTLGSDAYPKFTGGTVNKLGEGTYTNHVHNYTYELINTDMDDDTIKATCTNSDNKCYIENDDKTATVQIKAPASDIPGCAIYTGEALPATVTENILGIDATSIEYKKSTGTGTWEDMTSVPTDKGTYKASIKLGEDDNEVTASVTYEIRDYQVTFYNETEIHKVVQKGEAMPDTPSKDGYAFGGWFTEGGVQLTTTANITEDTAVYAKWVKKSTATTDTGIFEGGRRSYIWFGNYQQSSLGNTEPTTGKEGVDWINSTTATKNNQGTYYKIEPIKWQVLENANGQAFLISDQNLDVEPYNGTFINVTWGTSTIRSWLNGYGTEKNKCSYDYTTDNFINSAFNTNEKAAIANTTIETDVSDKIFLLSKEEAQNKAYNFTNNASRVATYTNYVYGGGKSSIDASSDSEYKRWWLRSTPRSKKADTVLDDGEIDNMGIFVNYYGTTAYPSYVTVRPAFKLNLSNVLFTSAAVGGKGSADYKLGDFVSVSDYESNEYKLTLKDSTISKPDVSVYANSKYQGEKMTVTYSASALENGYLSMIIENADGEIVSYARIADISQAATNANVKIRIPKDYAVGSYNVKFFAEQYNGDKKTDYASDFTTAVNLEVKEAEEKITFDVSDKEHVYNGSEKAVTVTPSIADFTDYKVSYYKVDETNSILGSTTPVEKAIEAGKYLYVIETTNAEYCIDGDEFIVNNTTLPDNAENYANAGYLTIAQSTSDFNDENGNSTLKADREKYTYGDTITITATPRATGTASTFALRSFTRPAANQMALFIGEKQISEAVDGVNGTYTMKVDTKDKALVIGTNTIIAQYVGNSNQANYSDTIDITLNRKSIEIIDAYGADRIYNGTTEVDIEGFLLDEDMACEQEKDDDGWVDKDKLDVVPTGTSIKGNIPTADAQIACRTVVISSDAIELGGTAKDYYELVLPEDETYRTKVTIHKMSAENLKELLTVVWYVNGTKVESVPTTFVYGDTVKAKITFDDENDVLANPDGAIFLKLGNEDAEADFDTDGIAELELTTPDVGSNVTLGLNISESTNYKYTDLQDSGVTITSKPVTFNVTGGEEQIYASGTARNITFTPSSLTADDFKVSYYKVNENNNVLESAIPVENAIETGKYLYVIDFATAQTNYTIENKFEVNGTALPSGTFDNAGYMLIKSGVTGQQTPIYFDSPVVNVYKGETEYIENNLTNNNGTTATLTSNNESVAKIENGKVKVVGEGSTVIIATSSKDETQDVYASYTLNVSKKTITVTADSKSAVYGTAASAIEHGYKLSEDVTVDATNVKYDIIGYDTNSGVGRYEIRVSGLSSDDYNFEYVSGELAVSAKELTIDKFDIVASGKEYDGKDTATISASVKADSLVDGDMVTVLIDGTFDEYTVGDKNISYEITGLSGVDSNNYKLTGTLTGNIEATITKAPVTVSVPAATTFVYDGNAKSVNAVATANGLYFSDFEVTYKKGDAAATTTAPTDVGTYTIGINITNDNYSFDSKTISATLEIKNAQQDYFTIEGISDTVYYGDVITLQTAGAIEGGTVEYEIENGSEYVTQNNNKLTAISVGTVTVKATSKKENYNEKTAYRTFTIKAKPVNVTATATDKTYDGTKNVTVALALDGLLDADKETVKATHTSATMATADVENAKTVFVNGITINSTNYQLTSTSVQTSVNVTKKDITAVVFTADGKVYDGNDNATYTVTELTGVETADKDFVTVTGKAVFDTATVGNDKVVTLSDLVLSGSKSGNYELKVENATAKANITKETVTFTFGTLSYVYDGKAKTVPVTAEAGGKAFTDYTVKYGDAESQTNVGTYNVNITLADSTNYKTEYVNGTNKLAITTAEQADLTITGLLGTIDYGKSFALSAVGGSSSKAVVWSSNNTKMATVNAETGVVSIVGNGEAVTITATKPADGNYAEETASVTFTPTKKAVSIKIANLNQTYDGNDKKVEITTETGATYTVKYNNSTDLPKDAGTYYVDVEAYGNYEGTQSAVLTIKKATRAESDVTLTVTDSDDADTDITYGETYTVTNNLGVVTYTGTGIHTPTTQKPTNAGSYTATVTVENANYETVVKTVPFTIAKKVIYAKPDDATRAYGTNNPIFTISYYSDAECKNEITPEIMIEPVMSTSATASSQRGNYEINANGGYAENYTFTYVAGTLTVTNGNSQNFAIIGDTTATVGDTKNLLAIYGGTMPTVKWSTSNAEVATVDENTGKVEFKSSGTVTITAAIADGQENPDTTSITITVGKKVITLNADISQLVKTYNGEVQTVTLTSNETGFVVDADGQGDNDNVTITYLLKTDSNVKEAKNVGEYYVGYTINDERYTGTGTFVLNINKADVELKVESGTKEYGEAPSYTMAIPTNVAGFDNDTLLSLVEITSEGAAATANVGGYDITATLKTASDDNCNYTLAAEQGKLTVTKAPLTIKVKDVTREYGAENPTPEYEFEGFKNEETKDVLTGEITFTYSDTITAETAVNNYDDVVTATSTFANDNYEITVAYEDNTGADLTITKIPVTASAGTSRSSYLTVKFNKELEGLTKDNFTVMNGETPVEITEVTASTDNKTYTLKGSFSTSVTYTVETTITSDTHEITSGNTLSIKPTSSSSGSSGGGGGGSVTTSYTVKFETDGADEIKDVKVTKNKTVAEPTEPTKDGYTFMGWFTDEELTKAYDFETKVTKNITLYAKWEKVDDDKQDETDDKTDTPETPVWENPFEDVETSDWYYADVKYAAQNGLFNGTSETTFAPNGIITRAMMVTVLYRNEGEPEVTGETTFEDVDENAYYANAVVWGQQNGIIKGYSETEFAPDENITREQIAAIMHRYAQYKEYDVSVGENTNILSYDDFDSISEYAIASMQYAVGSGLMKGKTTSTLNPLDNATRAEIAAILNRFIEANK